MKTYYELLGVAPKADPEEIKRSFRREIARYHPDKVQHLGHEFQEIASTRAAELTEAYRILMDAASRASYDASLASGRPVAAVAAAPAATPADRAGRRAPSSAEPTSSGVDLRGQQARATTSDVVRKAAIAMLKDAVGADASSSAGSARGFDVAFTLKGKKPLFGKAEPPLHLLARFVPQVDAAAIEETWPLALAAMAGDRSVCVLLLGAGVAPAGELSAAVAEQRRRSRRPGAMFVPVDVRDWDALFPPEAPEAVRGVLRRLKAGKG